MRSAVTLIEARLDRAAGLAHEIRVNGCTPMMKNKLSRAANDLNRVLQNCFALIVPDQPTDP
jgi:hypothetical protein